MTGVIVLNKPMDFTSFDAVAVTRKLSHEKKIGHTGTLDPMATGVLPLLLGRATKAASILPDTNKTYLAGFSFGKLTDTEDVTGKILSEDEKPVTEGMLINAIEDFKGEIFQTPPMYSAVSVGGQRLYTLARQGIEVEREQRKIHISALKVLSYNEKERTGTAEISCSKGTYIRTLICDIGRSLGCVGGIMTSLQRTYACGFSIENAVTLEGLRELSALGNIESILMPCEKLFEDYPSVTVTEPQENRFLHGGELDLVRLELPKITLLQDMPIKVMGTDFLGLGKVDLPSNQLKILKILK